MIYDGDQIVHKKNLSLSILENNQSSFKMGESAKLSSKNRDV